MTPSSPRLLIASLTLASFGLSACDRRGGGAVVDSNGETRAKTLEVMALEGALDTYDAARTDANEAAVKKAFAELDGEIADIDARIAKTDGLKREEATQQATDLRIYRTRQQARYAKLKAGAVIEDLKPEARAAGEKLRETAQDIGDSVSKAGRKIGDELKELGDQAGEKIK